MNYEEFIVSRLKLWNVENQDNKTIEDYNKEVDEIADGLFNLYDEYDIMNPYHLVRFSTSMDFDRYCYYMLYFMLLEDAIEAKIKVLQTPTLGIKISVNDPIKKDNRKVEEVLDQIEFDELDDLLEMKDSYDDFEELLEDYKDDDDFEELLKDDESLDLNISKSELAQNLKNLGVFYHINDLTEFYNKLRSCSLKIISVDDMVNVFRYYLSSIYEDKVDAGLFSIEVLAELVRCMDHTSFVAIGQNQISQLIKQKKATEYQVKKALEALVYFKIVTKHDVTRKIKTNSFHIQIFAFVG